MSGTVEVYSKEVRAYNRSVMPLDGLGCTCATLLVATRQRLDKCAKSTKAIVPGINDCNYSL